MEKYNIERRTPSTNWSTIHKSFTPESVQDFMRNMADGGYDQSGTDGCVSENEMEASYYDGGDLIQYRAVEQ
jgi:hypothetical protein